MCGGDEEIRANAVDGFIDKHKGWAQLQIENSYSCETDIVLN